MGTLHYYIISGVLALSFACALALLRNRSLAAAGNALGALCMLGAISMVLIREGALGLPLVWASVAVGAAVGLFASIKVKRPRLTALVACFNAFGGATSAIIAYFVFASPYINQLIDAAGALTLALGCVTFSGSVVAAAKLLDIIRPGPMKLAAHGAVNACLFALMLFSAAATAIGQSPWLLYIGLTAVVSLVFGVTLSVRVSNTDAPILISLLNAFSGAACASAGFAIYDPLLIAVGAMICASGLLLTQIMCRTMFRNIFSVLSGKTSATDMPRRRQSDVASDAARAANSGMRRRASDRVADPLRDIMQSAKTVVIVPGYGMALARAQHKVEELCQKFRVKGVDVKIAVHPVAGRMPGHMNILLAEAGVDYDLYCDVEEINPKFADTDLVIVVGANDVVNPNAEIIPVLNVSEAKHVIICNLDRNPGHSGAANPLYDKREDVTLLLGDAFYSVTRLVESL